MFKVEVSPGVAIIKDGDIYKPVLETGYAAIEASREGALELKRIQAIVDLLDQGKQKEAIFLPR